MTSLPSGLASISSRLDDTPNVRGAVAFGRMVRVEAERRQNAMFRAALDAMPMCDPDSLGSAIDRHAQLAVSAGYRSADRR